METMLRRDPITGFYETVPVPEEADAAEENNLVEVPLQEVETAVKLRKTRQKRRGK